MSEDFISFDPALRLIGPAYGRVNAQEIDKRKSIPRKLTETCALKVPLKTKFVHISFRTVDIVFGKPGSTTGKVLRSVYFEITNEDYSKLEEGASNLTCTPTWKRIAKALSGRPSS